MLDRTIRSVLLGAIGVVTSSALGGGSGACCLPSGECIVTDEDTCSASDGRYQGNDVPCAVLTGNNVQAFSAIENLPLNDTSPPAQIALNFPGGLVVGDVFVLLRITHTGIGDLRITIEHDGVIVTLWDRACGSSDDIMSTARDDSGLTCPPGFAFSPIQAAGDQLSRFAGQDSGGEWILTVYDEGTLGTGTLGSFAVAVLEGVPTCEPFEDERAHPGWNRVSAEITLTPNQPTYWSAASGLGSMGGLNPIAVPPFTSLDPDPTGTEPGRPCPNEAEGERCLRGYVVAWAVDANNDEIAWNHRSGGATIVGYDVYKAWQYQAWAHQAVGAVTGDGTLHLDGNEYSPGFDLLLMDFFGDGSMALSSDSKWATLYGDLTLHPLDVDARQGSTPVTTKAVIDVWNENEVKFDGLDRCITCWNQTLFENYAGIGVPNNLVNLQTNKGKARIDGRAGDGVCDVFDETEGPCGTLSSDICGEDAALTGLVAHFLEFSALDVVVTQTDDGDQFAVFGKNLVGMGTQDATVQYTPLGPPPTATTPERAGRGGRAQLSRTTRATSAPARVPVAAAAGSPVQDRASGTEKGSLLFISKVELRWNADGELIQDTFVSLLNDGNEAVKVQMEFINGDPPLEAVGP